MKIRLNIAGKSPENSRNSFIDLQSKKNSKKDRPKKFVFSLEVDMLYSDQKPGQVFAASIR